MSVTDKQIQKWIKDAKKSTKQYEWHNLSPNLSLRITPKTGVAVFMYRITIKNYTPQIQITKKQLKPNSTYSNWYTIGKYHTSITLHEANQRALELSRLIAKGINPLEVDKLKEARQISIGEVFNQLVENLKSKGLAANSIIDLASFYNAHLSKISAVPINQLSPMLVKQHIIQPLRDKDQDNAAHKTLVRLKQLSRFAYQNQITETDLLDRMVNDFYTAKHRERYLLEPELKLFIQWLHSTDISVHNSCYLYLKLLLGTRNEELLSIKWQAVDLNTCTILLTDTKNGDNLLIKIPPQGMIAINKMLSIRHGEYVFYSTQSKTGYMSDSPANTAIKTFSLNIGIAPFTQHDIRRTFSTALVGMGYSLDLIDKATNHRLKKAVHKAYIHSDLLEARYQMLCKWADYLEDLGAYEYVTG